MNTDIIDQANAIIVQGAEMVKRLRETLEEERAERERLQRVVDDLADALRKANRELLMGPELNPEVSATVIRHTLNRHGLLRPQDRPEMLPDSWRRSGHTMHRPELAEVFREATEAFTSVMGGDRRDDPKRHGVYCRHCGAMPDEECTKNCEDRR